MFENIGPKLKTLAKVSCCLGIIGSVIYGIIFFSQHQPLLGILWIILGSLLSWLSCLSMYGLGIVVDDHETFDARASEELSKQVSSLQKDIAALTEKMDSIILSGRSTGSEKSDSVKMNENPAISAATILPVQETENKKNEKIQDDEESSSVPSIDSNHLREFLEYALKFQTDDGLLLYLKREYRSLLPAEQSEIAELINLPVGSVRAGVEKRLKELS